MAPDNSTDVHVALRLRQTPGVENKTLVRSNLPLSKESCDWKVSNPMFINKCEVSQSLPVASSQSPGPSHAQLRHPEHMDGFHRGSAHISASDGPSAVFVCLLS